MTDPLSGQPHTSTIESPPTTIWGVLRRLGPGLIVAGSIVGSGELIATTKTGAEAGFWLLWLILIGCVIKVFVQVEFGRYSIVTGASTMSGLNRVPGPVVEFLFGTGPHARRLRGNWIVWYWFAMWLASIGQLGGIVGGVGQALAIRWPLTEAGRAFNQYVDKNTEWIVKQAELGRVQARVDAGATDQQPLVRSLRQDLIKLEAWLADARRPLIQQLGQDRFRQLTGQQPSPRLPFVPHWLIGNTSASVDFDTRNPRADDTLKQELGVERFYQLLLAGTLMSAEGYDRQELLNELGQARFRQLGERPTPPYDDRLWAAIIAVITSVLLVVGRYGMIQNFSTVMVCAFTFITVVNLAMLQANPSWSVTAEDVVQGMSFRLPPHSNTAVATALATFGIIGVGASELVTYPYWCLEKGYARFTGPRDDSPQWAQRARGWMRVMRWDAWCSMVIYTFATIAFYLLGAAVLGRSSLNPEKGEMIRTLAVMYEPVFTEWASLLFLFGAFAVLYSTYFVANASHARVFADTLGVLGAAADTAEAGRRRVIILSGFFPLLCWLMYAVFPNPAQLVLISGLMQAVMLPMLALAGLHFRYRCGDPRIAPTRLWDFFLWVSAVGMFIAGIWALISQFV